MKQHAIPQNILDIEFKLFSKFTIKQFVYIAIGVGIGGIILFIYIRSPYVPLIVALPLFLLSSGLGFFLGVVPINDQGADQFLSNYFKAITRPTRRVWRNEKFDQQFKLEAEARGIDISLATQNKVGTTDSKSKVIGGSPIATQIPVGNQSSSELDMEERQRLNQINSVIQEETGLQLPNALNIDLQQNTMQAEMPVQQVQTPMQQNIPQDQMQQVQMELAQNQPQMQVPLMQQVENQPQMEQQLMPAEGTYPQINVTDVPKLTLAAHNISQFAIELENYEIQPQSINLQLVDSAGNPVPKATVMIKDSKGKIIQVMQSDEYGLALSQKTLTLDTYTLEIQAGNYIFPQLNYLMEAYIYPTARINSIN